MQSKITKTLTDLGLASEDSRVLFSKRTRDKENLPVWRDRLSGVIYINDYYVGEDEYLTSEYNKDLSVPISSLSSEDQRNLDRRVAAYGHLGKNKDVCDFGCGAGLFIEAIKNRCSSVIGVELQAQHISNLKQKEIHCVNDIEKIDNDSIDLIVSFHVIEHLPDPISTLKILNKKLRSNGTLLVEVPHARDFLLSEMVNCREFRDFTLWSQHLILHTRESLQKFLEAAGFRVTQIDGVQRYPLSNHFGWLSSGRPGGHTGALGELDNPSITEEYEKALEMIDATDTIVAKAEKC